VSSPTPAKVREINFEGKWFKVRGPLTVPRTPQGPAGAAAGRLVRAGREFAAEWADLIFTGDPAWTWPGGTMPTRGPVSRRPTGTRTP